MNATPHCAVAAIPMQRIGPIKITGAIVNDEIMVPLATFESPLWPSVKRGARVTFRSGGIGVTIIDDRMTRSLLLETPNASASQIFLNELKQRKNEIATVINSSSRHISFLDFHSQLAGNLIYLRLEMTTGDAAGHNMTTLATEQLMNWLLEKFPAIRYVSLSGNYCTDKKNSAVNGILGRGKYVIAETSISRKICMSYFKSPPERIVELHIKKNLIGSILAGSVRTANAHFANILLAFYLATAQDAANIVEGSQGMVHAETIADDLYFSITLPNVIVGSIGNGKNLAFANQNLETMGCRQNRVPGGNARRLAAIAAATVLCGELSLLAALTHPHELMKIHRRMERPMSENEVRASVQ